MSLWPAFDDDDVAELEAHDLKPMKALGAGGFGEAILCEESDGNTVVVKIRADEEEEQFRDEPRILQRLDHENVCHYYRHWEIEYYGGFKLYIVMENCGESLRKTMVDCLYKRNLEAVFRAYSDSLRALEYIHSQNVMHRDISPNNFAILEDKLKIIDFGASCEFLSDVPINRTPGVGTSTYIAPEMYEEDYTEKVDVYSLGVVFYEVYLSAVLNEFHKSDLPTQTRILESLYENDGRIPDNYRNMLPTNFTLSEELVAKLLQHMVIEESKRWAAAQLRLSIIEASN